MQTTLKAGSASANITPPLGTRIPGGFRPRYAENVDDELFAKAVVIDNGTTRIAIVTCDLIAIPEKVADAAKARIADRCDIPVAHVMVNATHTHTAVAIADLLGVDEDLGYTEWVSLKMPMPSNSQCGDSSRHGWGSPVLTKNATFNRRWHMKDGTVRFNPGIETQICGTDGYNCRVAMMFVEANGTPISATFRSTTSARTTAMPFPRLFWAFRSTRHGDTWGTPHLTTRRNGRRADIGRAC